MTRIQRTRPLLLAAALATSCRAVPTLPEPERLTLYVAPQRVECMTEGVQSCLLVREHPGQDWRRFSDPIRGFTHREGFAYTLRVERHPVPDPPADASAFAWSLIEVLERAPAGP